MGIEKQRRFIKLVTDMVILTKPAPNWLQLEIAWLWPGTPNSVCYIWQRVGKGDTWLIEEDETLYKFYSMADRETLLLALPSRSWSAIRRQATRLGLTRFYQLNNSNLHELVSVDDAQFMAQVGIGLCNPNQRVWWIETVQTDETSSVLFAAHPGAANVRYSCSTWKLSWSCPFVAVIV